MNQFIKYSLLLFVMLMVLLIPTLQRLDAVDTIHNPLFKQESVSDKIEYDFDYDSSITKYLGKDSTLNSISYVPLDLVHVSNGYYNFITTYDNCYLRQEIVDGLNNFAYKFWKKFSTNKEQQFIYLSSCYRTVLQQYDLLADMNQENKVAQPGYSEHHLGLAVDINVWVDGKVYNLNKQHLEFLKQNLHLYGFHQSYQNGVEKDGYIVEPWHWRYLGTPIATYLHNKKQTYIDFYKENKLKP